jgi:hypothetical protein
LQGSAHIIVKISTLSARLLKLDELPIDT